MGREGERESVCAAIVEHLPTIAQRMSGYVARKDGLSQIRQQDALVHHMVVVVLAYEQCPMSIYCFLADKRSVAWMPAQAIPSSCNLLQERLGKMETVMCIFVSDLSLFRPVLSIKCRWVVTLDSQCSWPAGSVPQDTWPRPSPLP